MTPPRRKLLFVVTTEATARAFVRPMVAALEHRGFEVHLAFSPDSPLENLYGATAVHHVPLGRSANPLAALIGINAVRRLISTLQPDVCVGATPVAAFLVALLGRLTRVGTVIYLAWGLRSESLRGPLRFLIEFAERLTSGWADVVLANSPSLARAIEAGGTKTVDVLGAGSSHGVDLKRFHYVDRSDSGEHFRIGFVGRVRRDKGVLELVQAVEGLKREGVAAVLEVVGAVEDPAIGNVVQRSEVCFLRPPTKEVEVALAGFDVLCLPSWREGFPNVVLEAAATGLPAVVSDATGAVDSVIDGVTGITVPVRDAGALKSALRTLAEDPERRRTMGTSARAWVEREFEEGAVCAALAERVFQATP